ncbi:MAG: hypothetical protein GQ559_01350, partial [Desulfobulbaceae bacterium]|nr:hypothetical protein [Desulfobulbaceae bacterium]
MFRLDKFLLISSCALFFQAVGTATGESSSLIDNLYDRYQVEAAGFMETRGGIRLQDDADEKDVSMGEVRLRLEMVRDFNQVLFTFKGDLLADGVTEEVVGEIRDLSLLTSPLDNMDIKLGREVLTWGTGDLIFINDMFPKDWQSFFIGRDDEYLKAPSNAVKVSMFYDAVDIDIVYTPLFGGSEFINGERLSYYSPMAGGIVGRGMTIDPEEPNRYFSDAEISGRLSKNVDGIELALYGYSGFWQEPEGFNPETSRAYYPRLNVWGGSIRTSLLGGIGNLEAGYYDSINNSDANNPFIRPSEYRFLAGFERELARELTGGFQYYLEVIDGYDNYKETVVTEGKARDECRHMLTLRLTKLLMNQNLNLSLFVYYSPSDNDGYARPGFSYKLTDHWLIDGGFNLFWGNDDHTFWG